MGVSFKACNCNTCKYNMYFIEPVSVKGSDMVTAENTTETVTAVTETSTSGMAETDVTPTGTAAETGPVSPTSDIGTKETETSSAGSQTICYCPSGIQVKLEL